MQTLTAWLFSLVQSTYGRLFWLRGAQNGCPHPLTRVAHEFWKRSCRDRSLVSAYGRSPLMGGVC